MKKILLVNPWIYDFAAYDLWIKPWGLLKISSILKKSGFRVYLVDAVDRHHPLIDEEVKDHNDGTGKFIFEEVDKPEVFRDIPRKYKRYGLPVDLFEKALPDTDIDAVLVSSGMTYWYPGVLEAISIIRRKYGGKPVILGGVYATLETEHAVKVSGADHVLKNSELGRLSSLLGAKCDLSFRNILDEAIDHEEYTSQPYGVLRLSLGCPFDCGYCAQKRLGPPFMLKDAGRAIGEIKTLYDRGIRRYAFYDDALLFDNKYITSYLEAVAGEGMQADFYTPNGLHARFLTKRIARLMKDTNFRNPILSLEIANDEKGRSWHTKVVRSEIEEAVHCLKQAGYEDGEYMVYLMLGAPGSSADDIMEGIEFTHSLGAKVSLSEFSPVPGTEMAKTFNAPEKDPLLQNNSAFPSFSLPEWEKIQSLKNTARQLNEIVGSLHTQP